MGSLFTRALQTYPMIASIPLLFSSNGYAEIMNNVQRASSKGTENLQVAEQGAEHMFNLRGEWALIRRADNLTRTYLEPAVRLDIYN